MRLVSFGERGGECPGIVIGDRVVPVRDLNPSAPHTWRGLIAAEAADAGVIARLVEQATVHRGGAPLSSVRLGPPITDPSKIICVGLNYRGHAAEQGVPFPVAPLLFAKAPSALCGCADAIVIPDEDCAADYEVELAIVIGRRARAVSPADALGYIAGYLVANDVSARKWQKDDGQWFRAKSSDTFMPCGPALVTPDEVPDWRALRLTTTIGGEVLQDAFADDLIHDLPSLIAYASRHMTLEPGDIISTGTPAGVGTWRTPKRFLRPGEIVECAIAGLGRLANPVVR